MWVARVFPKAPLRASHHRFPLVRSGAHIYRDGEQRRAEKPKCNYLYFPGVSRFTYSTT